MLKEDAFDMLNTVISAQGACRRIIIWHLRFLKELKKLEKWLRAMNEVGT